MIEYKIGNGIFFIARTNAFIKKKNSQSNILEIIYFKLNDYYRIIYIYISSIRKINDIKMFENSRQILKLFEKLFTYKALKKKK